MKNNSITFVSFMLCCLLLASCASTKDAVYFEGISNREFPMNEQLLEPTIQKNDLLSITISSLNPQASEMFNVSNRGSNNNNTAMSTTSQAVGYLVDQNGYISFPMLGEVKAAGLSKTGLRDLITNELVDKRLLVEPVVNVRYLNYKVSVLGEVAHPAVLTVPNEKITLLEALGLAGDVTIYANRNNVLLIREEEGQKKLRRIDLTSDALFTSPYYYLKPNDILYVEPNKTKIQSAGFAKQWLPVLFSGLSVAFIAIDRLAR